jgi:hypothetical protein
VFAWNSPSDPVARLNCSDSFEIDKSVHGYGLPLSSFTDPLISPVPFCGSGSFLLQLNIYIEKSINNNVDIILEGM